MVVACNDMKTEEAVTRHSEPEVRSLKAEGAFLTPIGQSQPEVVGKTRRVRQYASLGSGRTYDQRTNSRSA
jgi:hypothetical protein